MVPSVKILAMEVRFNVRNDAKMIPSVLRCFPNVETLHIKVNPLMLLFGIHLHRYVLASYCKLLSTADELNVH
jgi:hypothetical protein